MVKATPCYGNRAAAPVAVHCTAGAMRQQENSRERSLWCLVNGNCLCEPVMKFMEKLLANAVPVKENWEVDKRGMLLAATQGTH